MKAEIFSPPAVAAPCVLPETEAGGKRAGKLGARTGVVKFELAVPADDAAIRRLLRENPMPGAIALTLEREPDYFADHGLPGECKQTIVARVAGRVVCVGHCTTRLRFINGHPRRVGYLGGLRLDASVSGRFDILRRGYDVFRTLEAAAPAEFYFTSIAADNVRARGFLERGVRGMPHYEFVGEFVTLVVPMERRPPEWHFSAFRQEHTGAETDAPSLAELLNQYGKRHQLAAHWTAEQLRALAPLGLRTDDFLVSGGAGEASVCAALWDQRCFKQTVIRGYPPWLGRWRSVFNIAASFLGRPTLPEIGSTLSHAFVFPPIEGLLHELSGMAARRQLDFLTLGFAADDPRLVTVRKRFRAREYRSRIYVVNWPGLGGTARELDGRHLCPEVGLL